MSTGINNLPHPGQDAVPLTPLTAQFYDETIDNIESLADGTGIGDGAIKNIHLSTAAGQPGGPSDASSPVFTNLPVNLSTVVQKVKKVGKRVNVRGSIVLAGGNKPSGPVSITTPSTTVAYGLTSTIPRIGKATFYIGSTPYPGSVVWESTIKVRLVVQNTSGSTFPYDANIGATTPNTFANGSEIYYEYDYEEA